MISLIPSVLNWRLSDPVPDELGENIAALEALLASSLSSCSASAHVVLLRRLFLATEPPPGDALTTWRERLERFPEEVLARACDAVIDTHKWNGPPKPAALVQACETDTVWQDMKMARMRMRNLKMKWGRQQASRVPNMPYNPAIADTVQATAYASQRARVKRINAEQEARKAERKERRPMSREEERRRNAAALETDTMKAAIAREEAATQTERR